jgi:hypothetical protein
LTQPRGPVNAKEVDAATLDGRAGHGGLDGLTKPQVGIGDDELHPGQPTSPQRPQERGPEGAVLAVANPKAEDLAAAVAAHPGGDHHGLGDDPPVDPCLAIGRVDKDVGEGLAGQRPVPERAHFGVQVGADPADLALADAAVGTQGPDQVVDLAGGDPVQVGLHHHRKQRLVHPPAPLQQPGEERPRPQLRDPQLQIPSRGGCQPGPVPVALGQPLGCPLVWGGADHRGELRLDEGLVDGLGGLADPVVDVGDLECVQDLQQCRLV